MIKVSATLRVLACCALASWTQQLYAQLTGTLFTEPEEREYLDYLRQEFIRSSAAEGFDIEESQIPEIPDGQLPTESGPQEFTFGGIMTRRDGSRSIWLNGRVFAESELPAGVSLVMSANSTSLRIANSTATYVLRPGQTVDLTTGSILENYQRPQADAAALSAPPADPVAAAQPADAEPDATQVAEEGLSVAADEVTPSAGVEEEGAVADTDAIAAAVSGLDDEAVETLFEVLENRRSQRPQAGDEPDDEPNNETR